MPKYEELKAFRKQNLIPEYNDSSSEKTMLHREARALAISRLEESARTEEEFANVISWWDKLDDNRERRERYHEIGRSEVPLEWHASDYILPGNANYDMKEHQKQLLYYVVVRSYSTLQYAELNGKTDRNVRGVRETAIKQIRKKYKTALETRLLHLPWTLTLGEKYFLENGVRTKDEKNSEKQ